MPGDPGLRTGDWNWTTPGGELVRTQAARNEIVKVRIFPRILWALTVTQKPEKSASVCHFWQSHLKLCWSIFIIFSFIIKIKCLKREKMTDRSENWLENKQNLELYFTVVFQTEWSPWGTSGLPLLVSSITTFSFRFYWRKSFVKSNAAFLFHIWFLEVMGKVLHFCWLLIVLIPVSEKWCHKEEQKPCLFVSLQRRTSALLKTVPELFFMELHQLVIWLRFQNFLLLFFNIWC